MCDHTLLNPAERAVLKLFAIGAGETRLIPGLAADAGLSIEQADAAVAGLVGHGLLILSIPFAGAYGLTEDGQLARRHLRGLEVARG